MKKMIAAALVGAVLAVPAQATPARQCKGSCDDGGSAALLLLGMIGVVIATSQLGALATRDGATVMVVPGDAEGDLGFEVAE